MTSEQSSQWPGSATTPKGPSGPGDYAVLNLTYFAGLVAVAAGARRRQHTVVEIELHELPVLGAAAFALADVIAKEKIATWVREPFVEESAEHRPVRAEGSGLRHAIGELVTCTRCVGAWSALGLVGLRVASPPTARTVSSVLAVAGINDFLQGAFRLLSERTNKAEAEARQLARD